MGIGEEIKEKFSKGLSINRMPNKTYKQFVKLAKDEFCNDYGLTLKMLVDMYEGLINTGIDHIESALEDINTRVMSLEQKGREEKKKGKVMMDGTERKQ